MTTYLLDINLLLALCDPMHVHHDLAHDWFASRGHQAWATCPLTENGFVRVASHPRYPNRPGDVPAVMALLRQLCQLEGHHFWPDALSLRDLLKEDAIVAHDQLTNVYLLGLAVQEHGKLATLDHNSPVAVVTGGAQALEIIST